jgi:hypothetical protein
VIIPPALNTAFREIISDPEFSVEPRGKGLHSYVGIEEPHIYLCCSAERHTWTDMNAICADIKFTNQAIKCRMRCWLWESIFFTVFPYICLQTILETVHERILPWSCPFIIHNHTVKGTSYLCCSWIGNCVAKYRFSEEEGATWGIYAVMNLTQHFMMGDRLCGIVFRVPGYRSRGPGSIPGASRFSEK